MNILNIHSENHLHLIKLREILGGFLVAIDILLLKANYNYIHGVGCVYSHTFVRRRKRKNDYSLQ